MSCFHSGHESRLDSKRNSTQDNGDHFLDRKYECTHNYVRPHMALDGKTPADMCGIEVKGNDKWKTLIQNASKI